MEPIRVFISCSEVEWLPAKVLESSIKRHVSRECQVKLTYEQGVENPTGMDHESRPRTLFSYHRFVVPKLCGFKGRAISMDSDMLVFADIAELFDWPMKDGVNVASACPIGRPHQNSSVMTIDCEACPWNLEGLIARIAVGKLSYGELMRLENCGVKWCEADHQWNCLDAWDAKTKNLHYTDMRRQPWRHGFHRHQLWRKWSDGLCAALEDGTVTEAEVAEQVDKGHVHHDVLKIKAVV